MSDEAPVSGNGAPTELAERGRRPVSQRDQQRFLEALANGWTVRAASTLTGRHHSSFYELRKADDSFADLWTEAWEAGTQAIEQEAFRRAVEGYEEVTKDGDGNVMRRVRRYDSALLQTLLKARRPEAYRDNATVQVAQINAAPVEVRHKHGQTIEDMLAVARKELNPRQAAELGLAIGLSATEIAAWLAPPLELTAGELVEEADATP